MNPVFLSSLEEKIIECRLIKSGTVADIWKIELCSGVYCFKLYKDRHALLRQQAEIKDLKCLSEAIPDSIPHIDEDLASQCDSIVLCLEWIENGRFINQSHKSVAEVLAGLHDKRADFAGLHYTNYIGELPQYNEPDPHWPAFWVERRLSPQLKLAVENKLLHPKEVRLLENYLLKAPFYLPELESFSLLHGDLWKGNVLTFKDGKAFLIDPAVYYGDPWVDLAMAELFGGFDRNLYDAYFDLSHADRQREELIPHYQLYYLLVHLNMFGRSYYPDIEWILGKYA